MKPKIRPIPMTAFMKISKGYRGEWVISDPIYYDRMVAWCEQTFGPPGRGKHYRWRRNYVGDYARERIYLKYEEDLTIFKLRWV